MGPEPLGSFKQGGGGSKQNENVLISILSGSLFCRRFRQQINKVEKKLILTIAKMQALCSDTCSSKVLRNF